MPSAPLNQTDERCLFIADLHLDPEQAAPFELALRFFAQASNAQSLFILGDLFEYWIGDDAGLSLYQPVIQALKRLSDSGCKLTVFLGNRDFLLGQDFADATGAQLVVQDEQLITLNDEAILLMHGDSLCIDDRDYQSFRTLVRDPVWQQSFLDLTVQERLRKAQDMRMQSKLAGEIKTAAIMDVNEMEVTRRLAAHGCSTMIHGHTHRPQLHHSGSPEFHRYVLGDWHADHAQYVLFDGTQLTMQTFKG